MTNSFIAIDWGTTNCRIYLIEDGRVAKTSRNESGVLALAGAGYEVALAAVRAEFGDWPLLMAGMVGSTIGWKDAGYVPPPAGLQDLADNLCRIDSRTAMVPGVAIDNIVRTDVMRGEEVQLLGAVAAGLVPADSWLCQPGTHCKWARMERGRITDFTTAMNGELFALLRQHGVLAKQLHAPVVDGEAFAAGVAEGAKRDLIASLFSVRSAGVLGHLSDSDAASYTSGLLIGSDVAVRLDTIGAMPVHVLADADLGGLYVRAVALLGGSAKLIDSYAAFTAGITGVRNLSR